MKYWDATDTVTGRWLCCVEAENEEKAKIRASQVSGVHVGFIQVGVRS